MKLLIDTHALLGWLGDPQSDRSLVSDSVSVVDLAADPVGQALRCALYPLTSSWTLT